MVERAFLAEGQLDKFRGREHAEALCRAVMVRQERAGRYSGLQRSVGPDHGLFVYYVKELGFAPRTLESQGESFEQGGFLRLS